MESENKRLHEWFGFCWHEPKRLTNEEREPIKNWFGTITGYNYPALTSVCVKCGDDINPINHNGVDTCYPRPKYHTESGFFSLLSGLRAKGFKIEIISYSDGRLPSYIVIIGNKASLEVTADTLPLALFNAALKALDAETSQEKATR